MVPNIGFYYGYLIYFEVLNVNLELSNRYLEKRNNDYFLCNKFKIQTLKRGESDWHFVG